jgi:hypothetical protein
MKNGSNGGGHGKRALVRGAAAGLDAAPPDDPMHTRDSDAALI